MVISFEESNAPQTISLEQQCNRSCLTENTTTIWYKFKELLDADVIQIEGVASSDELESYLLKLIKSK
jgi:hypothetical protein